MFWEMIAVAEETKQDLAILLLDFEKAYDRVVMGLLGLLVDYIKVVFTLYNTSIQLTFTLK